MRGEPRHTPEDSIGSGVEHEQLAWPHMRDVEAAALLVEALIVEASGPTRKRHIDNQGQ